MGKLGWTKNWKGRLLSVSRYVLLALAGLASYARYDYAASAQILADLTQVKSVLGQLGPALSAMLFIVAGVFYAVGQMLPPDKKAHFHTAAINIIIGAIVVAALSFASTSLATSSTQVLSNFTVANSIH
jgi:hypothetical protein